MNTKPLPFIALILCLLAEMPLQAQAPQGFNFQSVARDINGTPMAVVPIGVAFTILDNGNNVVYREVHNLSTDQFGLFQAIVGQGTPSTGAFGNIDWKDSPYSVRIEIDEGAGFNTLGTCDLQSVPYALFADKADMGVIDLKDVDLTGLAVGQTLSWDGTNWVPANPVASVWSQNNTTAFYNTGRVGIGVNSPETTFQMPDTSNLLIGSGLSGSGFKMLYYGQKGAFRVGYLNNPFGGYNYNKFWDYDSVGYYSFAAGQNSRAKGFGAFAFGSFGWADGSGSVAFFGNARGNNSFTFGGSSKGRGSITFEGTAEEEGGIAMYGYTGGRYGVSIGGGTTGLGASSSREDYAIAIGWNSDARGQASIALGPSDAYGYNSFSTGWVTEARGNYSSTFGYQTNSYPYASMALGRFNRIQGDSAAWVSSDPIFIIGDGTSNSNRSNSFMIQKNGQTVIGYNAPSAMLQVSTALGSVNSGGALDPTNAALLLGTTGSGMAFDANQIEMVGASDLYFNYNSGNDVRMVEGGGNVGIGKDPTIARLEIEQSVDNSNGGIHLNSATANEYWAMFLNTGNDFVFNWQGNDRASISDVNGAYTQLSDRRMKKDVEDLPSVLARVMTLQPKKYHYIDNKAEDPLSIGFIAQEVEQYFPELVRQTGEYKALSYVDFSVLAIKAIQEQQDLITRQKSTITELEQKLAQQEQRLQALEVSITQFQK